MSAPPHRASHRSLKLILISPDPSERSILQAHLEKEGDQEYSFLQVHNLSELRSQDLENECDVVLLDLRFEHNLSLETIRHIAGLELGIAIIALCRHHGQLQEYREVTHLLDDYILTGRLADGELPMRISHAIRRQLKEQDFLKEKTLLQSLLDNIPDAIYFKDRESRFIKINKAMEVIYGKENERIIGKTDFDLFAEEHARQAYDDEQEIIRTGEPMVSKIEKETFENGQVKWVNTTKLPLRDNLGRIIGTMGISRNVTELQKTEDTLAQERSLLKTIIEHALAGIFVKDLTGRYLIVNQHHAKYLRGNSEDPIIGKSLYDFFDYAEAARISAIDAKIMESGTGIENMIDHKQRTAGSELWLLTSKVPLRDSSGEVIGLVGISLDVTEQKLTERRLKSTIQNLEETKLQLIEAEKLKTVGRLAAGVAHEVKNPLSVVSLGVQYLESQIEEPEELLQIIRDMREAIEKANSVVFELLDYSSPHKMQMEPADINALIAHVLGLMRHNFNEAGIKVEETYSDEVGTVRIDAQKMEQVFINLFLNAISVMEKGGTLSVRSEMMRMKSTGSNVSSAMTELFRVGDSLVSIEVSDTGPGLSKEEASKAFDPFFSSRSTGEGTGLGLTVTRNIVDMHHGMITLKNRIDAPGATAQLIFPITNPNENED